MQPIAPPDPKRAWLPSVAAARERGLAVPDGVFEEVRLAALVVQIAVLRRRGWGERKWLHFQDAQALPRAAPAHAVVGAMHHVLAATGEVRGPLVHCQIHHLTDERVLRRDVHVPGRLLSEPEMGGFGDVLDTLLAGWMPEAHRCDDLSPRQVGAAYRSAPELRRPDFHGFDFGDALDRAAAAVDALTSSRATLLEGSIQAYAWPLLWLRRGAAAPAADCVLAFDLNGELHVVEGRLA